MSECHANAATDVRVAIAPGAGAAPFTNNGLRLFPEANVTVEEMTDEEVREVLRGTADMDVSDVDPGVKRVVGGLSLRPGRDEMDVLLPLMLGEDEGTGVAADEFEIGAGLKPFRMIVQRGPQFEDFQDCYIDTWEITGSTGNSLRLSFEVLGKTMTPLTKAAFDALLAQAAVASTSARAISFAEGALSLEVGGAATAVPFSDFTIRCNQNLTADAYSSDTPQCIDRDGLRELTFRYLLALNDTTAPALREGFNKRRSVMSFIAADATEFSISTGPLQWPNKSAQVSGTGKINHPLEGRILSDNGATPAVSALSITNTTA